DQAPEVAFAAALAWCGRADLDPATEAPALAPALRAVLAGPPEAALAALDHAESSVRLLAVTRAAAALPTDPRARERLIRLADGGPAGADRCAATLALARAGDGTAPDLVVKGLRDDPDDEGLAWLQLAAAALGEAAVGPLARRLRVEPERRAPAFLATLRALPLTEAVPSLLRGLEDARSGALEGALAATIHAGGPAVRAAVDQCLEQPDRGLLAPGLRFLAVHATAVDLPRLMALHDHHPPLRGILLNLVEGFGRAAVPALEARILAGGDDEPLARLEARLARLLACEPEGPA
ncbi:MAG: hypothetical protein H6702_25530, partial [Myxococcales bacterium]|nr:hypothetical protein [Myxococcales bacterium]